jgi:hypothetical protein
MSSDPSPPPPREPTIVFVFELKHWYNTISPLSKIDLFDIVPQVGIQFGYDYQSQAYLLVITKTKWVSVPQEIKKKYMMISRRIKEELDGPLTTAQREQYESADIFGAFEVAAQPEQQAVAGEKLESIEEEKTVQDAD